MIKKTIKYKDYDGNEREEEFRFNLSKAELMEMELSTEGGLEQLVNKIVSTQDRPQLIAFFKQLILKAYGEKSLDGRRFVKSKEISEAFSQTGAYTELFMELVTDDVAAANFVKGIMDIDLDDNQLQAAAAEAHMPALASAT